MNTLQKILDLMQNNNISGYKLSKDLNIATSSISDWKKGKSTSYLKYLPQLANYFGVSVEYLLNNEAQKKELDTFISAELLESLSKDSRKLDLAKKICTFSPEQLDRLEKILDLVSPITK